MKKVRSSLNLDLDLSLLLAGGLGGWGRLDEAVGRQFRASQVGSEERLNLAAQRVLNLVRRFSGIDQTGPGFLQGERRRGPPGQKDTCGHAQLRLMTDTKHAGLRRKILKDR